MEEKKNKEEEKETKPETEHTVSNSEKSVPASETPAKKNPTSFGLVVAGVVAVAAALALGGYFLYNNVSDSSSVSSADSGVEELEAYAKDNIKTVINAINFDELDSEDPKKVFDIEKLVEDIEESAGKLNHLASKDIDLSGKTVYNTIEMNVDFENKEDDFEGEMSLSADLYIEYPENYSENNLEDIEDLQAYLEDLDTEELGNLLPTMYVEGNLDYRVAEDVIKADFEYTMDKLQGYLKLSNVEIDAEEGLSQDEINSIAAIEDKVVTINAESFVAELIPQYAELLQTYSNGLDTEELSKSDFIKEFNTSLEQTLESMDEEDREILQRVGPKLMSILEDMINDYEVFSNVENVDPIREESNSKCVSGDVNFANMIEVTRNGGKKMAKVIVEDESYEGEESVEDIEESIDETMDELENSLEDLDLKMSMTSCSDKEDDTSRGIGLKVSFDADEVSSNIELQFLTVSYDSDYEIVVPEADMDFTEGFNALVGEMDLEQLFDTSMITDNLYKPLGPSIESDYNYDYDYDDSSLDDFNFEDFDYEGYLNDYDEITERYNNNEISADEYYDLLNELNTKYGY